MKSITVKFSIFNLTEFYEATVEHLKTVTEGADPQLAICVVEKNGTTPNWAEFDPDRDIFRDIEDGLKVFFPFSDCGAADPITCADGTEISCDWDEDDETEEELDIPIGEVDVVGFVLQKNEGDLTIEFGIHFGGGCMHPPCVDITSTGVFEDYMEIFIRKFISC